MYIKLYFLLITLLYRIICQHFLLNPISFGLIRHSNVNINFQAYLKHLGYLDLDEKGNNIGYNVISIDGFKTSTTSTSLTNDLSPLGTWANVYSRILGNTRNLYGKSSQEVQRYILDLFNNRASKILMNAFSFQRPVSEKNSDPVAMAELISQFVTTYNFNGVSVQFQDFHAVQNNTASPWLQTFLKSLRLSLGKDKIIALITYPTFIKNMPLFRKSIINSFVDLYVLKYYNLLQNDYTSYQTIFTQAQFYNGTALWQLQQSSLIKIDICKTIIAKPALQAGTWNINSFISSRSLNDMFNQALTQYYWFGGYANLDMGADPNSEFQLAALSNLREYCYRFQTCFCR